MKSTNNKKQTEDLKPGDELFKITDKEENTTIFTLVDNLSIEEQLERYLHFIEDEKNYYAGFSHVLENAIIAKQIAKYLCFNTTVFSDAQYHVFLTRIEEARKKAVKIHGNWMIKMLEQSKTQHVPRTLVSSVYYDIFGIELKEEE